MATGGRRMIKWRAYYDDGTTSDEQLKTTGVLTVVQEDPYFGRQVLHGYDWYYLLEDGWDGADLFGLLDQLLHNLSRIKLIVAGRTASREAFETAMNRSLHDEGFSPKGIKSKIEGPRT